jgi:hypothetical protein
MLHLLPAGSSETIVPIYQTTCVTKITSSLFQLGAQTLYMYILRAGKPLIILEGGSLLIYI